MLLIRFQPRRVVNVVVGLTLFWCGIISALFWVKGGFNFGFLVMLAATVVGGFFLACMQADWQAMDTIKRLGFKPERGLKVDDMNAFASETHGVKCSIGSVPFRYIPPARLDRKATKSGEFECTLGNYIPKELLGVPTFLDGFIAAIDSGPHRNLVRAILEVYCHPDNIGLPAGISRHNGETLLTHCLRVAALMHHRVDGFTFKNYYIQPIDPNYKLDKNDGLLMVAGLAHDLGKITSLIRNQQDEVVGLSKDHHKASSRILSSLPEFWSEDLSSEERYILQSVCIYSTDEAGSPVKVSEVTGGTPTAVSDRFQTLLQLVIECDKAASKIENGTAYDFTTAPERMTIEITPQSVIDDTKIDLLALFSEFIATRAIVNGKGAERSIGFKYLDKSGSAEKHLVFVDTDMFGKAFCDFIKLPEMGEGSKASGAVMALLPKLDEAGYLVRGPGLGNEPAVNALYKVDFYDGDPPTKRMSLKSCFVLDVTNWPHMTKLRTMESCVAIPKIVNNIFGNKFVIQRQSLADVQVYEELSGQTMERAANTSVEALVNEKALAKANDKTPQTLPVEWRSPRIQAALEKGELEIAAELTQGGIIVVVNSDAFFKSIGVQLVPVAQASGDLVDLGILSIRASKKNPGSHIVILDGKKYNVPATV